MRACRAPEVIGLIVAMALPVAAAPELALPVIEGQRAVAVVNGEPISAEDFFAQFAALHRGMGDTENPRAKQQPVDLLERLISIRLVLQEARNIGLDELPQVQEAVARYRVDLGQQLLFRNHTRDLSAVDPKEYEARYREAVKQIKVRSLLVNNLDDATKLTADLRAGGDFDQLSGELLDEAKAEADDDSQYLPVSGLMPDVREAMSAMKIGDASDPIKLGTTYAVFLLVDMRWPDDPELKSKLEREALQAKRMKAVSEYKAALEDKYVEIDQELLDELDLEGPEPGFDALLEDRRVVATIAGETPIFVGDLAQAIKGEFYHGAERKLGEGRLNERKTPVLNRLARKKAVLHEVARLKLEDSEEYVTRSAEYENGVLFQAFLEKVVEPGISVKDAEMTAYLAENHDEFSSPEMMRLDSLGFAARADAEGAMGLLREGVDYKWVQANAPGLLAPDDEEQAKFPERLVMVSAFPAEVGEAVSGAAAGDYRLLVLPEGVSHVLRVRDVVAPQPQPLAEVRSTIGARVYARKRSEALEDWMVQLREASEIEVYANADALTQLLGEMMADGS